MKKKIRLMYGGVAVTSIVAIVLAVVLFYSAFNDLGITNNNPSNNNSDALYVLRNNPTEYQKEVYDELIKSTKNFPDDYDKYEVSELVVKSFIADFYTWSNKVGNYDVGGLDYVYGQNHLPFGLYARDTFYQNFNFFMQEYGVENLMSVIEIETESVDGEEFEIEGTVYETVYVRAKWTYGDDSSMDVNKLQSAAEYSVFYNDKNGRYEILTTFEIGRW